LSIMVRPDNGDDRMHLVVLAPGHAFRHGAAVGPARVRVADVGDPAFQEAARGHACRRRRSARCRGNCGLMVRVLASSMMGSRAVISAGAGCCRAERAGQRVTVFADNGRVLRSVTVTRHRVVVALANDRIIIIMLNTASNMLICLIIFGCRIRIGQRHGGQFRRLMLEKRAQPGRRLSALT
jgi:hypothetical protein